MTEEERTADETRVAREKTIAEKKRITEETRVANRCEVLIRQGAGFPLHRASRVGDDTTVLDHLILPSWTI